MTRRLLSSSLDMNRELCTTPLHHMYWQPGVTVQSISIIIDTEGAIESVRVNGLCILSRSCYLSKKYSFYYNKILKNITGH